MTKVGRPKVPRVTVPEKDHRLLSDEKGRKYSVRDSFVKLAQSRLQEMLTNRTALLDRDDETAPALPTKEP